MAGAAHIAGPAATIVLVAPVTGDLRRAGLIEYDHGQATIQMALAATDLGIGSGHSSIGDQDALRRLLGIPEDSRVRTCSRSAIRLTDRSLR